MPFLQWKSPQSYLSPRTATRIPTPNVIHSESDPVVITALQLQWNIIIMNTKNLQHVPNRYFKKYFGILWISTSTDKRLGSTDFGLSQAAYISNYLALCWQTQRQWLTVSLPSAEQCPFALNFDCAGVVAMLFTYRRKKCDWKDGILKICGFALAVWPLPSRLRPVRWISQCKGNPNQNPSGCNRGQNTDRIKYRFLLNRKHDPAMFWHMEGKWNKTLTVNIRDPLLDLIFKLLEVT